MTMPSANPDGAPCCDEYAAISRRGLFTGALALAGAATAVGSAVVTASPASAASAASVLVVVSMRGAADGLSLVVPHADPVYYAARPRIAVPADRLLVKDAMFGLHPNMTALLPLWNAGQVAAVHATGLPVANRSHFAAMEEIEDADPGSSQRVGWLNRLVGTTAGTHPLQGFGVGTVPTALYGPSKFMSGSSVKSVEVPGADKEGRRKLSLETLWANEKGGLGSSIRSVFSAIDAFDPAQVAVDNSKTYPGSDLGRALSTAARIIRGDVGVEVITVDQGNWDMHTGMGTPNGGWMADKAKDLANSIAAFMADLGPQAPKVTLLTISEFGRRVVENDGNGTDHGHGNVMFAVGAGVKGGYHGRWPGLANTYNADLAVTTDYRNVLADVVEARFGASTATVFPGLKRSRVGFM